MIRLHPLVNISILGYLLAVNDGELPILGSLKGIGIKIMGLHPWLSVQFWVIYQQ